MIFYILLLLIAFITSLLVGSPIINLIRKYELGQSIREDGPKSHITTKAQTPTIGGIIFLIPTLIFSFVFYFLKDNFRTLDLLMVLLCTLIFSVLGLADDLLKIKKKKNKGVSGWTKLIFQLIMSILIFCFINKDGNILQLLWIFLVFAGSCNAYNLTDGLDGLASSIGIISLFGLSLLLSYLGKFELTAFCIILMGALLGFLCFNKYPAKVFMGDTGSLALGAAVGSLALVTGTELFLLLFAIIPVIEALSVIAQVMSSKLSKKLLGKDKRLLKMAPLHHHFELIGWKETDIVAGFSIFQLVCVLVGIAILYLWGPLR